MVKYYDKNNQQQKITDEDVNIYVCGPTVYNHVHIGNLRPIIFFSVLRNIFKFQNKTTRLLQNITDVDDKILNYAMENKLNWKEVANKYKLHYFDVLKKYNIDNIEFHLATDYISTYEKCVDQLIAKEYAYELENGVYLRVNKIKQYGIISHQDVKNLIEDSRIKTEKTKEHSSDFAILKKDLINGWDTKYGRVRPGWHLECFGIINAVLGSNLTIHGGGIDLLFPHHENENALNLALNNKNLAQHWMHVGMLTINGEKMSKSVGNLILAKDFVEQYDPNVLKLIYLQNSYSKPINITDDLIKSQVKLNQNIRALLIFLSLYQENESYEKTNYLVKFETLIENIALPNVCTMILKITKDFNKNLIQPKQYHSLLQDLKKILEVLDLVYDTELTQEDFVNINLLNSNNDFEYQDKINQNKRYIKTRKGWTIK